MSLGAGSWRGGRGLAPELHRPISIGCGLFFLKGHSGRPGTPSPSPTNPRGLSLGPGCYPSTCVLMSVCVRVAWRSLRECQTASREIKTIL